jgi:cytochrome c biogenesis protein CcmG/thiol:disulfide interchange protein DsbE
MPRHVLILALAVAAMGGMASASPRVGGPAPGITAKTLDGSAFDLASMRGRVVVINVWATWCTPCRVEMPALNAVYGELHGRGLEMIGLSADKPRDRAKVRQIMAAFSYPAATADQTHAGGLTDASSLPITYVVDKMGTIRAVLSGGPPLTVASLEKLVTPLMGEPQP